MNQLNMFDVLLPTFRFEKDKPIRVVELFSGIGFQAMGIELAEIPYEVVATSEIDKYAIASYEAIHGISNNLGDISKLTGVDFPKEIDIMTYSFPCQDLSKAGKQKGMGESSRSGLVYEVIRILQDLKELDNLPKVLIMENVVDLVQIKFIRSFNEIQKEIEDMGYSNYTQILNAKNYGIAQNRDRVFMVSILGEYNYNFPKPFELTTRLKDYLEDEVDERYYLSDKQIENMLNAKFESMGIDRVNTKDGIVNTITTMGGGNREPKIFVPTIDTMQGGYREPLVFEIPEATKRGYAEAHEGDGVYINRPHQKRGVVQKGMIQTLKTSGNDVGVVVSQPQGNEAYMMKRLQEYQDKTGKIPEMFNPYNSQEITDVSPTITTMCDRWQSSATVAIIDKNIEDNKVVAVAQRGRGKDNIQNIEVSDRELANSLTTVHKDSMVGEVSKSAALAIRKLTPIETGRLMGMSDYLIEKQLAVVSNAQAYKQHGNGIVAQVIGLIIGMMYYEDENELREIVMKNSHT